MEGFSATARAAVKLGESMKARGCHTSGVLLANSFLGIVRILAMQLGIQVRLNCFQLVGIRPDQSAAFKGKEAGLMGEKVTIEGSFDITKRLYF